MDIPPPLMARPFTVREGLALGLSPTVLEGRRWRRPWPGVRVPAHLPDDLVTQCRALSLLVPHGRISHETALTLHGLPVSGEGVEDIHITVPAGATAPRLERVIGHVCVTTAATTCDQGFPVTEAAAAWCEVGERLGLDALVVSADAMLRRGLADQSSLAMAVTRRAGGRGVVRLRTALGLVEPDVDSPMETRFRLVVVRAGLPRPVVNRPVFGGDGGWLHTPDLSWPRWRVGADFDGGHHLRGEPGQRRRDIARKEALEDAGWVLRVFTATDVLHRPELVVDRLRVALRRQGAPG